MFHSNPYYYWSLMSVVMYVGIVCSVLVLMIMFTDTVYLSHYYIIEVSLRHASWKNGTSVVFTKIYVQIQVNGTSSVHS